MQSQIIGNFLYGIKTLLTCKNNSLISVLVIIETEKNIFKLWPTNHPRFARNFFYLVCFFLYLPCIVNKLWRAKNSSVLYFIKRIFLYDHSISNKFSILSTG